METRRLVREDLESAWALDHEAFNTPKESLEPFLRLIDPARFDGIFDEGRLVALSGAHGFGQFFGGRVVPMGGLTTVAVAPDRRGRGLGKRVVRASLSSMRDRGELISALYPATTSLYRGLGWEMAGTTSWRTLAPEDIEGVVAPSGVEARPALESDASAVHACYEEWAAGVNGALSRPDLWWQMHTAFRPDAKNFVVVSDRGEVEGYLAYRQVPGDGEKFRIVCDDLFWVTQPAGAAVLRLLGSWRTMVERITYRAGADDPFLWWVAEQQASVAAEIRWMVRLIDVAGAIAARGYEESVDVHVSFELTDTEIPENAGSWQLEVRRGRGRLERGGSGDLVLDVGALSAVYSGGADVRQLERADRIRAKTPDALRALGAAFSGPAPWMLDDF